MRGNYFCLSICQDPEKLVFDDLCMIEIVLKFFYIGCLIHKIISLSNQSHMNLVA